MIDEPYRGYAPDETLVAQAKAAVADFQRRALEGYPQAARAWREWVSQRKSPATGFDYLGATPWLPYLPGVVYPAGLNVLALHAYAFVDSPFPWPSIGPDNFNFGGHAAFSSGGFGFAQSPDWRDMIARAGGNPDDEYMSAYFQSPREGSGKYDYVRALYVRSGAYWRPIAAYSVSRESSWVEFRDFALKPGLAFFLSFGAGAFIAAQIGPAIMGSSFAASYPTLTTLVGQTVMQTALNGGDVEVAVRSVAASYAGSVAGAQLGAVADSKLLGKVSGAALTSALQGGDVQAAALQALAVSGATSLGDYINPPQGMGPGEASADFSDAATYTPEQMTAGETQMAFANADYFDPVYTEDQTMLPQVEDTWSQYDWSIPQVSDATQYTDFDIKLPDGSGSSWPTTAPNVPTSTPSGGWVADVTNVALAAIKVNAAYQASKAPAPRTVTQSGATTSTPNANGTVTVRNTATGQTSVQRPQAGVPYVLPDGRIIINNGNGTYSVTDPNGATRTMQYAPTTSGGSGAADFIARIPPYAWGIAAAIGIAMLRGRR